MKKLFILSIICILSACERPSTTGLLTPRVFAEEIKSNPDAIVIDVRSPEEIQGGYIEGAINLNFNAETFSASLDSLDHSKTYFIYCASGKRSGKAMSMMNEKGFQKVSAMEGGLRAWNANGLPMFQP